MLENLLEGFKKAYEQYGDDFISDAHRLDEGLYIRVYEDGKIESHIYKKLADDIAIDPIYKWFQKRDFISKYLESNKAIPTKPIKRIHSNNYLTWFVKKDTIVDSDKALTRKETIEMNQSYFEALKDKKLNSKVVLNLLEGDFSEKHFGFCQQFMTDNYPKIEEEILKHKEEFVFYVKVFFDFDFRIYQRESNRYFYHKIFNSDAYNLNVDGTLYGLSNFNMGLNAKKPYLEHKTMTRNTPYMVSLESALLAYKYSLYLKNHGYGLRFQRMEDKLTGELHSNAENLVESQNLIYLTQDNGNVIIEDYDIIPGYKQQVNYCTVNHLDAFSIDKETSAKIFKSYSGGAGCLERDIDEYLFLGNLKRNYFTDGKSLKPNKFTSTQQVEIILQCRKMLFDAFHKEMEDNLTPFVERYGVALIMEILKKDKRKAIDAFNVYYSLKKYCKGEDYLKTISDYKKEIKSIAENEVDQDLSDDNGYSFAAGQLTYYLISQSVASKKNHDLVESFLNRKTVKQLNEEITYWFKRYAHNIPLNFKKFNRLYRAVLTYDQASIKKDDIFLAGYLSNNIFYEKREVADNE